MAHHGSPLFESYSRNLRRLYWSEFIDQQLEGTRPTAFRASLVSDPQPEVDNLAQAYDHRRNSGKQLPPGE